MYPRLETSGLAVGVGFFQLRVHGVIPCLSSLPTNVYFETCITKAYHVGHPLFSAQQ